ncbi:MAG: Rne/Rng family ribonuclease [bacterium]|nr:Rne/Rng family ribonuclease [bacterium]
MHKQILINAARWETRVAVLEDTTLVELHIERHHERGIAGNIYKGKVVRVLPGMQAAFLDIGLEKAAFLHVSDLALPETLPPQIAQDDAVLADETAPEPAAEPAAAYPPEPAPDGDAAEPAARAEGEADPEGESEDGRPPRRRVPLPPIEERLKKGEELLVQVAKEPMGTKGARVTAHISLPGRHLVYMPGTRHIGISRRIEDPAERDRLREIVEAERPAEGGLIVRTACEGATKRDIHDDVRFLTRLWSHVQKVADGATAPSLIHQDLDLPLRTVRDLFTSDVERLVVDDPDDHARVVEFVEATMPRLTSRVHHYEGSTPLFDQHGVETKIVRALDRRVWLKSGGYLIFDQTESLTTVDVNTGRYVGKTDQEETVLRTNLEAAKQVVQQLRLRNIGGIIVIDFIDMEKLANRKKVFDALQEAMRKDKARSNVLRISELGLVQMTRKRTRESLEQLLTAPCPHCDGHGRERSAETLAYDALRRLQREVVGRTERTILALRVPPDVAEFLALHRTTTVAAVEKRLGTEIVLEGDASLERGAVQVVVR